MASLDLHRQASNLGSPSWAKPVLLARITTHPDLPECAGCGRCCHLVVELRDGDWVPEPLVAEHYGARCMDQHGDGACVALDPVTRLCTIYDIRPLTCRVFTRGELLCRRILGRHPTPG
jgi:Fe-S-cluster containining protein